METKPLLYGIAGLIIGGLIVSIAASLEAPKSNTSSEMTMTQMTEVLKNKKGDEYDRAFLDHMVTHHRAAIDMAKLSKTNAKHEEIKQLSEKIIAAQEKEITDMKQWQVQWGHGTDKAGMDHHQ